MQRFLLGSCILTMATSIAGADANVAVKERKEGGIVITRPTLEAPLLVFNAPEDGRPYLHPLLAPDGKGVLTEFSPSHHKHQTGIYVGFLKVNGRDYFHNRGGDHFRRKAFTHKMSSESVTWKATYDLLDKNKDVLLTETQSWSFQDFTRTYVIDLTWSAKAHADVTFEKYEYGGLFVRMPFKNQAGAVAINSERQKNGQAEGKEARWVDISMTVDGRDTPAHIAVMSQPPQLWRVDGQLGVGPAPSRSGAWKLLKGETATMRYRFYVYTGEFNENQVDGYWQALNSTK